MRVLATAIGAIALIGAAAQAQAQSGTEQSGDPGVGVGIICDTLQQAEHFVSLRANGSDAMQAIDAVNAQAHDTGACGIATVAFLRDRTIDVKPMGDKLVKVVRINIVAGFNGKGWQRVSAAVMQYAIIDAEGEAI